MADHEGIAVVDSPEWMELWMGAARAGGFSEKCIQEAAETTVYFVDNATVVELRGGELEEGETLLGFYMRDWGAAVVDKAPKRFGVEYVVVHELGHAASYCEGIDSSDHHNEDGPLHMAAESVGG